MQIHFVDLAIPVAVDSLFTYIVPSELQRSVKCGVRVLAPFGKRTVVGLVVALKRHSTQERLKSIYDVLDTEPLLSDELLHLTHWISEYYFVPEGEVVKAVLVQGSLQTGKRIVTLRSPGDEQGWHDHELSSHQKTIMKELIVRKRMSVGQIQKKIAPTGIHHTLQELVEKDLIVITEEPAHARHASSMRTMVDMDGAGKDRWSKWLPTQEAEKFLKRSPRAQQVVEAFAGDLPALPLTELLKKTSASLSTVRTLARKQFLAITKQEVARSTEYDLYESALGARNIVLNEHQRNAVRLVVEEIISGMFKTFLLFGVTGSGKTQVYIEAIRATLARGKTAIVLVPEISLTPQIVRRFKVHFGDLVAVMHSRMSKGERYDTWRAVHEGKCSVVIGPRSAVFAPLKNIGLIVVDEEQEQSYKQFDQTPRYHARDVAIVRARAINAVVLLGSATPSFESYANAVGGKYTLLELPQRVDTAELPKIEIVDMTAERKKQRAQFLSELRSKARVQSANASERKPKFDAGTISSLLKEKIEDRLRKKEGIILLQNRRGFATYLECPDCGYVAMCEHCNISLTYHQPQQHLRCHYCGMVRKPLDACPQCASLEISYHGFGTQRIEEELGKLFPTASIIRMDLDTTTKRGAHDRILKKFSEGDVDILLGTQMVAKGLDFSRVTLVGVISADTQMLLPDFRSSERTFQLLTQVAGRAGRSAIAGEVVIQTYQSQHDSLKHVTTHDFKTFYDEELLNRRELDYPPLSRLVLIEFKGSNESEVMRTAASFAELLKKHRAQFSTLGPAAAAITRIKGLYRWHIVVKSVKENDPSGDTMHDAIQSAMQAFKKSTLGKSSTVRMIIDVDPVGMM